MRTGLLSSQLLNTVICTDTYDLAIFHSHGLDYVKMAVDGDNFTVVID